MNPFFSDEQLSTILSAAAARDCAYEVTQNGFDCQKCADESCDWLCNLLPDEHAGLPSVDAVLRRLERDGLA